MYYTTRMYTNSPSSPSSTFLSIFLKGDERSMEICSCYSKSGEAGIRVIRMYRDFIGFRPTYFYWLSP